MLPIILTVVDDDDRIFVEKLYCKYEKQLYIQAMKYLENHYDAQDCVHEAVRAIINGIEKFKMAEDLGYIEKLLSVVCRNCALNMLRVRNRRVGHEQSLSRFNYDEYEYEEIDIPDYEACVDKIYVSEENCEYLRKLINQLDSKYRDVVLLKSMGLGNDVIADMMNISEELVRQRYSRARKKLLEMGGKDLYA